jgi:hypothetical protein
MFTIIQKLFGNSATQTTSGCGGCRVKSAGNCTTHLAGAVPIIVQGFIDAKISFNPSDQQHLSIATTILAEHLRDADGNKITYDMPTDPAIRNPFLHAIQAQVRAGLGLA